MKVNPVGKQYSETEKAYAAGLLDGDGAIMATIEKHQEKKFGFRVRITVKITQSQRKILDWFLKKFRIGLIRKNRTTFDWQIRDQKAVAGFLDQVIPYLKVKKPQAKKALRIMQRTIKSLKQLQQVANLADSLARLNVRSKGRRKNFVTMVQENCSRND